MKRIYAKSEEKFVKSTIVYFVNNVLCYDEEGTKPITSDELEKLYLAGTIVVKKGSQYCTAIGLVTPVENGSGHSVVAWFGSTAQFDVYEFAASDYHPDDHE